MIRLSQSRTREDAITRADDAMRFYRPKGLKKYDDHVDNMMCLLPKRP